MPKLAFASAGVGGGSRSGALALFLVPLAGLLSGCGPSAGGDENDPDGELLVLAATPTNGQEVNNSLSDPELDNKLTLRFSTTPARSTMLDETNSFNGLTPYVQFLDQSFARVPGTPSVDPDTQSFFFEPENKNLVNGQYTLTVSKFVTSPTGNLLNHGVEDFSTSFTVGQDTWTPVVRNYSPAPNQKEVPLYTPVVVTFNESLDPASVVYGQTVFVQDGGTNPPTQLGGTVLLKRDGFDLVYLPDPCIGMPPATTIVVRMLGAGNTTFIKDRVGNGLVGDPANNNELSFQFSTKGIKPLPNLAPFIGSPKTGVLTGTHEMFVTTSNKTVEFDTLGVYLDWAINRRLDPSHTRQVLQANAVPTVFNGPPQTWAFVGSYGGDWEVKFGKAGEGIPDWRLDTVTFGTYVYQIDEENESIVIYDNFAVVQGRFKGLGTPRGLGMSGPFGSGLAPVLFVSNYAQATVTGIPLGLIQPGIPVCTAVQELNDDTSQRVYMMTGKNPTGVAMEYWGSPFGALVNQGDNTFQVFDTSTLQPFNRLGLGTLSPSYQVGENPVDCSWSPILPGGLVFAYIANQGGPQNPEGSVSLWWNQTSLIGLFNSNSGSVATTVRDGMNVPGAVTSDPRSLNFWVPNTAGNEILRVDIAIVGGYLGQAISTSIGMERSIGPNPTKVAFTGVSGANLNFVTLAGLGQVAVFEQSSGIGPVTMYPVPGCRSAFSRWDQ